MPDDAADYISRGFQSGSILRIKMKNFLTYSECEFHTGPRLNIVIGPNGTGKSALTHAICLACCGTPGDVGRSNDLSKFVKHGSSGESFVEVDILDEKCIATIRRTINSDNRSSKWTINKKIVKQSEVKELVSKLSIDVDNLCSFMPQDKVGSFSRFTPKEVLSNTLKSVENPNEGYCLASEQNALSLVQDDREVFRRDRDSKQKSLDTKKTELESMNTLIEQMQRRQEAVELLKFYEIKRLKVELDVLQKTDADKQRAVDAASALLVSEQAKIGPLEAHERDLKRQQLQRDKAAETATSRQHAFDQSLRSKKEAVEEQDVVVEEAAAELEYLANMRASNEQRRQEALQVLHAAEEEHQQALNAVPAVQQRIQENVDKVTACLERQNTIADEMAQYAQRSQQIRDDINRTSREFNGLKDYKQIYRGLLSKGNNDRMQRDALIAMDWLSVNEDTMRQQGQLKGAVYGPVAMLCDVSDVACAAMIEKVIPANKLLGFIVENDNDARMLKQELRVHQRLEVDIFTMKVPRIDTSKPYSSEYMDATLCTQLRIQGYLCDQIKCPDIVRSFFYVFHTLNHVLWARASGDEAKLSSEQLMLLCPPGVKNFRLFMDESLYTANNLSRNRNSNDSSTSLSVSEYAGRKSRFARDAPPSTSIVSIRSKGLVHSRNSNGGDDDVAARRAALEATVREAQQQLQISDLAVHAQQGAQRQVQAELVALRAEKAELIRALKFPQSLENRITQQRRIVAEAAQKLSVNAAKEKSQKQANYKDAIKSLLNMINDTVETAQKSNLSTIDRSVAAALKDTLHASIAEASNNLREAHRGIESLVRDVRDAQRDRDDSRKAITEKSRQLEIMREERGVTKVEFVRVVFPKVLAQCPENTLEAIEDRIAQLEEQINRVADNPQLQQRYDNLRIEVQNMEAELEVAKSNYDHAEELLRLRAEKWLKEVMNIERKLDINFRRYMADLQLGGRVELRMKGNYNEYELQIKVQFREASDMCDLDGNKHSGGERAVATVMFLMALQDGLARSPFRVVDEINQGMDESNERLVFDRIVKSCCGDNVTSCKPPQYFLVTPKLLQGLRAMNNKDVTILLVWNGPGTHTKWTFRERLADLTRRARQSSSSSSSLSNKSLSSRSNDTGHSKRHIERNSSNTVSSNISNASGSPQITDEEEADDDDAILHDEDKNMHDEEEDDDDDKYIRKNSNKRTAVVDNTSMMTTAKNRIRDRVAPIQLKSSSKNSTHVKVDINNRSASTTHQNKKRQKIEENIVKRSSLVVL